MDNLALLISYVENERDSIGNPQVEGTKKQAWKNPKVWLSIVGFCLSLFTICLSGAVAEAAPVRVSARNGLNVRKGPSTGYRVVRTLYNGQAVNTSGRLSNGWAQLDNGDWVVRKYLNYSTNSGGTGGGSPNTARIKSVYGVNVRSGPSTRYRVINGLSNGTKVKISGRKSGKWVQLANGYWVHGDFLSFGRRSSGGGTGGGAPLRGYIDSYTSGANIRSGPGTRYSRINYFNNGTELTLTGRVENGWYELTRDRGWIAGNLLRT